MRLHQLDEPDAEVLARYAATIQLQRQDFNGRLLTIRRDDLRVLAAVLGRSPEELALPPRRARPPRRSEHGRSARGTLDAPQPTASIGAIARYAADDVPVPSPTQLKVLVPGNHLMVDLLGQRDELLRSSRPRSR